MLQGCAALQKQSWLFITVDGTSYSADNMQGLVTVAETTLLVPLLLPLAMLPLIFQILQYGVNDD